jgi:hypothetical protein
MITLVRADPSLRTAGAVSRCGQGGANARKSATIERTQCSFHRGRQIERVASTVAWRVGCSDRASISGPMARDCGTGVIHCGGQTDRRFAAEIRSCTDSQGKTALAIVWKVVPIGREGRQGALSVRRGEGGGSCGASWWSMTTCTPALPERPCSVRRFCRA